MSRIQQVLRSNDIWENINSHLNYILQNRTQIHAPYTCQSRTLTDLIRQYTQSYYGGNALHKATKTLTALLGLVKNYKTIRIYGYYKTISSEESTTYTLNNFIQSMGNCSNDTLNLHIYHIPKGKTYLRKLLDENTSLQRIPAMETLCINNTFHFIRVYQGFGNTNPEDITIITDQITPKLLETFFIMLPNLYNANLIPVEGDIIPEEYTLYNNKIDTLRQIFAYLYSIYTCNDPEYTSEELTRIKTVIHEKINTFLALFNFETAAINSFTENLAKARNRIAEKHFKNLLQDSEATIKDLEERLTKAYVNRTNAQRNLNSIKTIATDDVKPFMETIRNTKAIEVLHSSENTMKLRITAPLQYFTKSDFEAYENNATSHYNTSYAEFPMLKRILHKIFVTKEYKILMQAIINLRITNESYASNALSVSAQQNDNTDITQLPNPHLYKYNCWDKAKAEMQKNISEGNFELVVMQMVAAVQTINVAEHQSFVNGFLYYFKNNGFTNLITILDKDNNAYTYNKIIDHEYELEKAEKKAAQEQKIEEARQKLEQAPKQEYTQIELPDDDDWEIPTINPLNTEQQPTVESIVEEIRTVQAALTEQMHTILPENYIGVIENEEN